MATTPLAVSSERWLDEIILATQVNDVLGATLSEFFSLPAGLGDVALMSLLVQGVTIDVIRTPTEQAVGVQALIYSSDAATVVDVIGASPWLVTGDGANALTAAAYFDPDALVLWRQNELLNLISPEIDADATATGDLRVRVKCVRVRPIAGALAPMKLVR